MAQSSSGPGLWPAIAARGIAATADAMFPPNAVGAPDWLQAEMLPRMLRYLDELPPRQRRLLLGLFVLVELGAPLMVPGLRRFSRLTPQRRLQAIGRWRASRLEPLRLVGDGLKMTMTMLYLAHPAVRRHIGELAPCAAPAGPAAAAEQPDVLHSEAAP
jgi:hypothetical protein